MGRKKHQLQNKDKQTSLTSEQEVALLEYIKETELEAQLARKKFSMLYNKILMNQADKSDHASFEELGEHLSTLYKTLFDKLPLIAKSKNLKTRAILLDIKIMILAGQFGLATVHPESKTYEIVIDDFNRALSTFKHYLSNGELEFKNDLFFQEMITFALSTLRYHINASQTVGREEKMIALAELSNAFAQKCTVNFIKLYESFFYLTVTQPGRKLNIFNLSPSDKSDFMSTYRSTIHDVTSGETDGTKILRHAQANLLTYKFEYYTRPHSLWKLHESEISPDSIKKLLLKSQPQQFISHLKLACELRQKYADATMDLLHKADMSQLIADDELKTNTQGIFEDWSFFLRLQIKLFSSWEAVVEDVDLKRQIRLEVIRLELNKLQLLELVNRVILVDTALSKIELITTSDDYNRLIHEMNSIHKQIEEEAAERQIESDKMLALLLRWQERQGHKKHKPPTKSQKTDDKKIASASTTTPDLASQDDSDKSPTISMKTAYDALIERAYHYLQMQSWEQALEAYQAAAKDASDAENHFAMASAMDGEIYIAARMLLQKINTLHTLINKRLITQSILKPEERNQISQLVNRAQSDFDQFEASLDQYRKLLSNQSTEHAAAFSSGIHHALQDINEFHQEIHLKIHKMQSLYRQLKEMVAEERERFLMKLGRDAASDNPSETPRTDEQIRELGLKKFADIGKSKKRKDSKSQISREYEFINQLDTPITQLSQQSTKLQRFTNYSALSDSEKPNETAPFSTPSVTALQSHEPHRLTLSTTAQEAFSVTDRIPGKHRLVGSSLIYFYYGIFNTKTDIDFVSECSEESLIQAGFHPSSYVPFLYSLKTDRIMIDVMVLKSIAARTTDFTICTLLCDHQGNIEDPFGCGIDDLINMRLRTVDDPATVLANSPISLLRAIKYMVTGFQPDMSLHEAMIAWHQDITHEVAHLHHLARKHLMIYSRYHYTVLLQQYGLLEKLFNIANDTPTTVAIWKLEQLLNLSPKSTSSPTFFSHSATDHKNLSRLIVTEPRLANFGLSIKQFDQDRRLTQEALDLSIMPQRIKY